MFSTGYLRLQSLFHHQKTSLAICIMLGCIPQAQAGSSAYDKMIVQARAGNSSPVLDYLADAAKQRPLTPDEVADWLQIAGWANQDQQVTDVWQRYSVREAIPARGVVAAARAYRNLKQWERSRALWQQALQREPQNDDLHSGLIMTLADSGRATEAVALAMPRRMHSATPQHFLDLSYAQRAAGQSWDALQTATQGKQRFPQDVDIQRDYLATLSLNRLSGPALRQADAVTLTPAERRQVQADAAAEKVRLATTASRSEAERFRVADDALADYDRLLASWKNTPEAHADYQRARVDRLGALVARSRMQEATDEYQRLVKEGQPIPAYAQRWVASAWLYQRQPDNALALYQAIRNEGQAQQLTRDDQSDLFYAYSEDEQPERAVQQSEDFNRANPYYRRIYGSPLRVPNDSWLDSQQLRVQSSLFTDDLDAAQQRAEHLANTAPGNQGLQIDRASLYLARGWPRKAEAELKRVESMDERNIQLETQQGQTALDLQEWRQVDLLADDVSQRQPENRSTQRLDRLRDVHHMSELRIEGEHGIDSDSPVSGANDFSLDALLYGPPMDDRWRLFSGISFNDSEFENGRAINRNVRGGVEYRARDNWAEAEINTQNYGEGQKTGLRLSGWHDVNDQWRVGGSVERLMRDAPLQALRNGITVNGGTVFARWRQNESRQWQASVSPSVFSDGNQRLEYNIDGQQRLYSGTYLTLDFTPNLSGSHNSKTSGPYYSPSNDVAVVPAVTLDHLMYRHYQTEWSQQVELGAGGYWQQGQGTGAVTTLGYGQRVRWNDVLDTGVMLTWDKRPYDGVREQNLSVSFDMNYRF